MAVMMLKAIAIFTAALVVPFKENVPTKGTHFSSAIYGLTDLLM